MRRLAGTSLATSAGMTHTPRLDHTQIVPEPRSAAQESVGDEGGATLVGGPRRTDVDAPADPPPTTPPGNDAEPDDTTE